jgi:pimeloyl-ACP methyl ester carboxylesterase
VSADSRPLYIDSDGSTQLGFLHPPAADVRRRPVLVVPPWGWEEVASYRARRDWAMSLAEAGHPTLRFSLPATGNSSGAPTDPDLLRTWVEGVRVAAARLSDLCHGEPVAALGLGLGGLLALAAAADSPIVEAALWGAPQSGSTFVREMRAFSMMEQLPETGEGIPASWLEAGGFVLTDETIATLKDLTAHVGEGDLRRALLLGRGAAPASKKVEEALAAAAVEVTVDVGPGWQNFIETPEVAELPTVVAGRFEDWLHQDESSDRHFGVELPDPVARTTVEIDGVAIREEARFVDADWGRAFVVSSAPAEGDGNGPAAVFLNAGAVSTAGPNRMWVEISRTAAGFGISSVRLDLQGVGEADGEVAGALRGPVYNQSRYGGQVREILGELPDLIERDEFVPIGLCAGARNAFQAAFEPAVREVIMVNGSAIHWSDDLPARREALLDMSRDLQERRLHRALHGEIPLAHLGPFLRSLTVKVGRDLVGRVRGWMPSDSPTLDQLVEADLDRAAASGTRLTMAFSGSEGLLTELKRAGIAAKIDATDGFAIRSLPGRDHTLRPASSQAVLRDLILDELKERAAEARVDRGLDPAPNLSARS